MSLYNRSFFLSRKRYLTAIIRNLTLKKAVNLVHCYLSYVFRLKTSGSVPPVVIVMLTYKCNYRCIMCQKTSLDENEYHNPASMDFSALKTFIENYADRITIVRLFGGEPLFYPQMDEVLDLLHKHKVAYAIGTNGALLTPAIVDKITDKCAWVSISLDSADNENYAYIRAGGDLETIKSNLSQIREVKQSRGAKFPIINANATIFTYNLDGVNQLIRFCKSYDIESLSISAGKLYNTKEVKERHLIHNDKAKTKQVLDDAKQYALELDFNLRVKMRSIYLPKRTEEKKQRDSERRNFGLYFEITIQPDFNAVAAYDNYKNMGVIENSRLEAVWNGRKNGFSLSRDTSRS